MSSRIFVWLLCAGALALACGPRSHGEASSATTAQPPTPRSAKQRSAADSALAAHPLATSLDVSVKKGVTLALHVTNRTDKQLELMFPSGQTHDFTVLDANGREVWRWSAGRMFTQALQSKVLAPHETATFEETWDAAPALKGDFTAIAKLASSNHPVEEHVGFALP